MKTSSTIRRLSRDRRRAMRGVCWKEEAGCPAFESLRLLELAYWDFGGACQRGELVVHERIAEEAVDIFEELFASRFPLQSMRPIEVFEGDDERSVLPRSGHSAGSSQPNATPKSSATSSGNHSPSLVCAPWRLGARDGLAAHRGRGGSRAASCA